MPEDRPDVHEVPARVHDAHVEWHAIVTAELQGNHALAQDLTARVANPLQLLIAAAVETVHLIRTASAPYAADPELYWRGLCEDYLSQVRPAPPPRVDPPR